MSELKKYWCHINKLILAESRRPELIDVILDHATQDNYRTVYLAPDVKQVIAELISTLRALHDVQNGSPLPKYDRDWKAAMEDTERLLAEWEKQP